MEVQKSSREVPVYHWNKQQQQPQEKRLDTLERVRETVWLYLCHTFSKVTQVSGKRACDFFHAGKRVCVSGMLPKRPISLLWIVSCTNGRLEHIERMQILLTTWGTPWGDPLTSHWGCLTYRSLQRLIHTPHYLMADFLWVFLMTARASFCRCLVSLNLWTWEKLQTWTLAKGRAKGRLSLHGLALQDRENAHRLKNVATRGSKKHGADEYTENLIKSRIPSRADRLICLSWS